MSTMTSPAAEHLGLSAREPNILYSAALQIIYAVDIVADRTESVNKSHHELLTPYNRV